MQQRPPTHSSSSLFQERTYRNRVRTHLHYERIVVQETDLAIYSDTPAGDLARDEVLAQRGYLEGYIAAHPQFASTLTPWPVDVFAPPIVRAMIEAGRNAGVGPMAAVAGAVAEAVGQALLGRIGELVVENGGDIFLNTTHDITLGIFAGSSPLSMQVGLSLAAAAMPLGVCTSSGSVGHSLSLGRADAACVLSRSCGLADAAATAIGNRVRGPTDIQSAINWGRSIPGVLGIVIVAADKIGAWGEVQLVPL
jgi:ApbE superfamily uncharacterized protein (UPF0280 family)